MRLMAAWMRMAARHSLGVAWRGGPHRKGRWEHGVPSHWLKPHWKTDATPRLPTPCRREYIIASTLYSVQFSVQHALAPRSVLNQKVGDVSHGALEAVVDAALAQPCVIFR